MNARDAHLVRELHLAGLQRPIDGRRPRGAGRAGHRNMALACEQARGRIKPDPARARQKDLTPGVQIGEIRLGARRPVDRLDVGGELNEIARDKPGRHAQMAQQIDHQPGGIAAGARAQREGLFRRLHTRIQTDGVGNALLQGLIDRDQKIDGATPVGAKFFK